MCDENVVYRKDEVIFINVGTEEEPIWELAEDGK